MKKVLFAFAILGFVACNNEGEKAADAIDSAAAVVDSTAGAIVDSAAAVVDSTAGAIVDSAKAAVDSIKK